MSGPVPHNGTSTSIEAARSVLGTASTQEAGVYEYIRAHGLHGRTRDEIAADMHLDGNSVRPRCSSLIEKGLVEWSGELRRTGSGRAAKVLVASCLVHA